MNDKQSDWDKPFAERYLACADAISILDHWLAVVGMSGNTNFARLKSDFIQHGGDTFNDMRRTAQSNAG